MLQEFFLWASLSLLGVVLRAPILYVVFVWYVLESRLGASTGAHRKTLAGQGANLAILTVGCRGVALRSQIHPRSSGRV